MNSSQGKKFKLAVDQEHPLQIIGTLNTIVALMAKKVGYRAIYLSGAGVANSAFGLPDEGLTSLDNVLEEVRRITAAVDLPLLVDIDTGWGNEKSIARTIKAMIKAGAASVHIEDQVGIKRCGHLPGKAIVPQEEMVDRIKAAVDAKTDPDFVIMARTDALAVEGFDKTLERAIAYKEAGADMLFPEAITQLEQYRTLKEKLGIPILANITEFGKTPLYITQELFSSGVDMVLYPLSITRAMNKAALNALTIIRKNGTQKDLIKNMQTRDELYDLIDYKPLK